MGLARDAIGHRLSQLADVSTHLAGSAAGEVARVVQRPGEALAEGMATAGSIARFVAPVTDTLSPVMVERHAAWHYGVLEVPLRGMLAVAHEAGVRHNDAFLAGVTAGLRLYHDHHDAPVDELRVTMPMSIRRPDDPIGGNRITLMRFKVPVSITDPVERMSETHLRCEAVKCDRSLPYTNAIAGALNLLPRAAIGGMLEHIDFVASNVPGIAVPLYLTGAEVKRFYGFGPTIGAALNLTLMSYRRRCLIGVTVDTLAVPDPDVLMDCLRLGFDEVLAVGGGSGRAKLPSGA